MILQVACATANTRRVSGNPIDNTTEPKKKPRDLWYPSRDPVYSIVKP